MARKDDLLRARAYGNDPYYEAIRAEPAYQTELTRTQKDYQGRSWIDLKGFLPKFSTEEFEKRRTKYQEKYGNTVQVPGFNDVIHIIPQTKISTQEMAAHRYAQKRGLPSPLDEEQINLLATKKARFLRMLSSPEPSWMRTYGAVATAADNVEDATVTLYWAGRLAISIAPRLLGKATPILGWLRTGSDVLNAVNLFPQVGALRRGCKSLHGALQERNPFSAKARAERAGHMSKKFPGFGAFLEILQTTDQLFGVGLSLGGLMGMVQDTAVKTINPDYWKKLGSVIASGNVNEIADWTSQAAMNDYTSIKTALQQEWTQFKDEAYRLKATDKKIRDEVEAWIHKKGDETWDWIKTIPQTSSQYYYDPLIGSMILSTGQDDFEKDQHTKAFIFLNQCMTGVMDWWYQNDPIQNMKDIKNWKWTAPAPKEPDTIALLEESIPNWQETIKWPHIEKKQATFEEIAYTYAPKIKDSFQSYCIRYQHDYDAMAAAHESTDFIKNVIRSYADDHQLRVGMDAQTAAAIDMIDQGHIIAPETSQNLVDQLSDYIRDAERKTAEPPKIKDVINKGNQLGIKWMNNPPKKIPPSAEELFPGWRAIQDQLGEYFQPDYE